MLHSYVHRVCLVGRSNPENLPRTKFWVFGGSVPVCGQCPPHTEKGSQPFLIEKLKSSFTTGQCWVHPRARVSLLSPTGVDAPAPSFSPPAATRSPPSSSSARRRPSPPRPPSTFSAPAALRRRQRLQDRPRGNPIIHGRLLCPPRACSWPHHRARARLQLRTFSVLDLLRPQPSPSSLQRHSLLAAEAGKERRGGGSSRRQRLLSPAAAPATSQGPDCFL